MVSIGRCHLLAALKRQRAARVETHAICERLEYLGKVIYAADVLSDAKGNVGRPHIAKALVQAVIAGRSHPHSSNISVRISLHSFPPPR